MREDKIDTKTQTQINAQTNAKINEPKKAQIKISKVGWLSEIESLKQQYIRQATAPLDGMWLCGFVPLASHYRFDVDGQAVGFFCINEEGHLLQFYLDPNYSEQANVLFRGLLSGEYSHVLPIEGCYVSTAEPAFLSHCLDNFNDFTVNALMYQLNANATVVKSVCPELALRPVSMAQLPQMMAFVIRNIGAPEQWLRPYFNNLIRRQELYACWQGDTLVSTGESRGYTDYQQGYADLGLIVDQPMRGKGVACWMMQQLVQLTLAKGLQPICSTERDNIAAQKAISHAGFVSTNRILQFKQQK